MRFIYGQTLTPLTGLAAQGASSYTAWNVNWTGTYIEDARAYAISESGYVLCQYDVVNPSARTHAYWTRLDPSIGSGLFLQEGLVPHPGFDDSFVRGVAMVGQQTYVAGWVRPTHGTTGNDYGYTWPLNAPSIVSFRVSNDNTRSYGINAVEMTTGRFGGAGSRRGFLMAPVASETPITTLLPLSGYFTSWANALNLSSLVVGASVNLSSERQATTWLPATATARALDWLDPQYKFAEALGVNRNHHAVGFSRIDDPYSVGTTDARAVLWTSPSPTDLGVLSGIPVVHSASKALAINDGIPGVLAEEVVGTSWDNSTTSFPDTRAFVWDAATGMRDLNAILSVSHGLVGVQIQQATGINSLGEISAIGFTSPNGPYVAVLLTPDITSPRLGRMQAPIMGSATTMHGIGFTPSSLVTLVWDTSQGSYFSPPLLCQTPMVVDPGANSPLATAVADQRGRVEFPFTVPSLSFDVTVHLQAYEDNTGCGVSNVVTETVH